MAVAVTVCRLLHAASGVDERWSTGSATVGTLAQNEGKLKCL